jgi:hypothetical protein
MSKFKRYNDVPFLITRNVTLDESEPELSPLIANSASFSMNQDISVKRFIDDHKIKFVISEDKTFYLGQQYNMLLGETEESAMPIPESIKSIKDGSTINFDTTSGVKSLFVVGDHNPGSYYLKVQPVVADVTLTKDEALNGKLEQQTRTYSTTLIPSGSVSISFFIDGDNYDDIFNPYGVYDLAKAEMIDESGCKIQFGEFIFNKAYLSGFSFDIRPFSPVQANANFVFYGDVEKGDMYEGAIEDEETLPHGLKSRVSGTSELGLLYPVGFSYNLNISRQPKLECPIVRADESTEGESPTRVHKSSIEITANIEGEDLDVFLDINGKDAKIQADLYDLSLLKNYIVTYENLTTGGIEKTELKANSQAEALAELAIVCPQASNPSFVEYKDQSKGFLKSFVCDGKVESNKVAVSADGIMSGSISVKQILR